MADPDDLPSAPPGVAHDAGSANTIAATIEAAKAIGLAHVLEISQDTLEAGSVIGDEMPLPVTPDVDSTELQGAPLIPPGTPVQGGSYTGDQ